MDGYGKEALDITVDYLDLLGGNKVAVGHARMNSRRKPAMLAVSCIRRASRI